MPTPSQRISVTMPDGTVITDVPADISQEELWSQYQTSKAQTPIDRALSTRENEVADYQAKVQQDYMDRQAAIQQFENEHPEARVGAEVMREPAPLWAPYLNFRQPPIAPRESEPQEKMGSGFAANVKMGLVRDPETRRKILAQTLFPNDPGAYYRVGFDADGQPVYVGDDKKLHKIASGTEAFAARLAHPSTIAGALGAFGGPGTAAVLAAGAEGLTQVAANQIFNEPQSPMQNAFDMGVEGLTAGAGELLGRAYVASRNAGRIGIDFPADEIRRGEAVRNRVLQNTGVDLNLADASDDPFLKGVYQFGWRQPGQPSRNLREARTRNDQQFATETNRVLNLIARGEPSEESGQRVVNAARDSIRRARRSAQAVADPEYEAAYLGTPRVTDPQLMQFFNLPGWQQAFEEGQVLAQTERHGLRPGQPPDLRAMDYWKRALDTRIENLERTDPTLAGAMRQRVEEFVNRLDQLSPAYARARNTYRQAHASLVQPLLDGKVGTLARIDNPQARTAAAQIFEDANVSAQHIAATRAAIERENPAAWRGVVRQWLASKWDDALQRTQSAEVRNPAGKLQASVFGSPEQENIARAMLTPRQFNSFNELMYAAQRLASTPVGGSTTPHDIGMGKALESSVGQIRDVLNAGRHPWKSAEDTARKIARERNIMALTDAILDPTQRRRLQVVTRMRPGRQQAVLLGTILSEELAKRGLQSTTEMGENSKLIAGEDYAVGEP